MNYINRVQNIYKSQKNGDIYYRYFTRYISAPITAILSYTKVTPNMATLAMFFFGILGSIFFSFGDALSYIFGGLSFVFLIVSDTVDGELARFKGTSSLFGDYLDRLAHYVTNTSMILGIGIGVYSSYQYIMIFYISGLVLVCLLFDDISRDLLISCGLTDGNSRKQEKEKLSIVKGSNLKTIIYYTASNTAFFHLIIITAILDIIIEIFFNSNLSLIITHLYIIYFFFATVSKMIFRLPLIISLKNK
jgi:phosphatidylglycerophosphate synthase